MKFWNYDQQVAMEIPIITPPFETKFTTIGNLLEEKQEGVGETQHDSFGIESSFNLSNEL